MVDTRPLLARDVYAEMKHALGGTSDLRPQDLLNDVLDGVTSMHEWDFLAKGEAFVDLRGVVGFSGWSWTASTKTLFDPTASGLLASYTRYPTDLISITAGGTTGYYGVASKVDDDTLTLDDSVSASDLSATAGGKLITRCHLLPSDFDSLIDAGFVDNTSHLSPASRASVARSQRNSIEQNLSYCYTVEWVDQSTPMMRLDPSPTTAAKSAIAIVYRKRLALVGTDGAVINAPRYLHRLIKDVARALVRGLEMPGTYGEFHDQVDRLKQSWTFRDAVNADGRGQIDLGRISHGGHVAMGRRHSNTFPPSTISVTGP